MPSPPPIPTIHIRHHRNVQICTMAPAREDASMLAWRPDFALPIAANTSVVSASQHISQFLMAQAPLSQDDIGDPKLSPLKANLRRAGRNIALKRLHRPGASKPTSNIHLTPSCTGSPVQVAESRSSAPRIAGFRSLCRSDCRIGLLRELSEAVRRSARTWPSAEPGTGVRESGFAD